jgi:hypothetical protein
VNFIGKIQGRMFVKLNSDFLPNAVSRQLFAWRAKLGEIDP